MFDQTLACDQTNIIAIFQVFRALECFQKYYKCYAFSRQTRRTLKQRFVKKHNKWSQTHELHSKCVLQQQSLCFLNIVKLLAKRISYSSIVNNAHRWNCSVFQTFSDRAQHQRLKDIDNPYNDTAAHSLIMFSSMPYNNELNPSQYEPPRLIRN